MNAQKRIWSISFIVVTLANALVFMIFEMLLPTLPLFVDALGGNAAHIGLVTGIFMFSAILVRPFAGMLAAQMDKKWLLMLGLLIMALSTGGYYLADTVYALLTIRLIHGAGFGLTVTYFTTMAAEIIPKERRGEGIGYFGVGETVAISVGPMIGIGVLNLYGFQWLFVGGMAVMLLTMLMVLFIQRDPDVQQGEKHEKVSFTFVEKRVLFPALLIFLVGLAAGGIMSFFSVYAEENDFSHVGVFFLLIAAAGFLVRLVSGKLFDRYGPPVILVPGALLAMAGLTMLYVTTNTVVILVAAVCYGFGFGAIFPAIQTWCLDLVGDREHENAMASFFNFFDLGIGGGSLVLGVVAAATSYQTIYLITSSIYGILILTYLLSLKWTKRSSSYPETSKESHG
ncbi:MFS transporter [Salibacterium lacus]|uniref:MFS transporter n=1 Tax=Salibacterium lacus TaxID=1898109 RepID=A0ABW5T3P3_9BACI